MKVTIEKTKRPNSFEIYFQEQGKNGRHRLVRNLDMEECENMKVVIDWFHEKFLWHIYECEICHPGKNPQVKKPIYQLVEAFKNTGDPRLAKVRVRK